MSVEIRVLGRFAVRRDGADVDPREFGGKLTRQLVRILAASRGSVLTRDALVEALWGARPPADPDANLNVLVNRARRALGEASLIRTVSGGYLLDEGESLAVDAHGMAALVALAREQHDRGSPSALATVETALDRWGEPWPEDAYADWAAPHRDRLHRIHQEALEIGAAAAMRCGRSARAVELAEEAVAAAPLREPAHLLLVQALAANGDSAAALAAYDRLRTVLADELGIDPSGAAEHLHTRLLRGESAGRREGGPGQLPFVGRSRELAALRGGGRVVLLAGQPGAGKSRLLAELAATTPGAVVSARAVLPEREYPWSLCRPLLRSAIAAGVRPAQVLPPRWSHALAELLPELGVPQGPAVGDPGTARALVLQAAARLLEAAGPALVLVDDLQWADATSLELLALLAARAEKLSMVLAYRVAEAPEAFLRALRSSQRVREVRLAPLDAAAIGELAGNPALARLVVAETDRTPFAVVEALRAVEGVEGAQALERARDVARAGRRRSVLLRVDRHTPRTRELLGLLSLLGRPASADLLADAGGAAVDAVLERLDALASADLVTHGERGFATSHDLVAETVRDALAPVERARLHGRLARALRTEPETPGERARHLAGAGDLASAAAAYAEAARNRLDHFADVEAQGLAEDGLALGPGDAVRADLLEVRAEALFRAGGLDAARADLREAIALTAPGLARARLLTRLAGLSAGSDDLLRAANLVELALLEAGEEPEARARALTAGAIIDMNLERERRADERFDEALALFQRVGAADGIADILDARAMRIFMDGEVDAAIGAFHQVAQLFTDSGNLLRVVTPRSVCGHARVFGGRPADGLADVEEALEIALSLGYREGEAVCRWHRSEALTALGRLDDAVREARRGSEVARAAGHRGWTAMTSRALGIALEAAGDLRGAETACRLAVESSVNFPLSECWAHARLALVLTAQGRLDEAAEYAESALVAGPPLAQYEARLAGCALAVARGAADADVLMEDAMRRAAAGGHRASLDRLRRLR